MESKFISDKLFWWFAVIFSIAMSIIALFYTYRTFYLYNLKDVQANKFVVKEILEVRGSLEQESTGRDYLITGIVLANKKKKRIYYKALKSYNEDFFLPDPNDTIDIWYSKKIEQYPIILKVGEDYPKEIFLTRTLIYFIISVCMIGAVMLSIVKIKKL